MTTSNTTISVRLPKETRQALDKAAKATGRSRASLIREAVNLHLPRLISRYRKGDKKRWWKLLYELQGAGARDGGRSAEEIDAMIQEMRGGD